MFRLVVMLLVSFNSYALEIGTQPDAGGLSSYNFNLISKAKRMSVKVLYGDKRSSPKMRNLTLLEHQSAGFSDGKLLSYYAVSGGRVSKMTAFDGVRMKFRSVSSDKNRFIIAKIEYNKVSGITKDTTNVGVTMKGSDIGGVRVFVAEVPVLAPESGVFYVNIKIGEPIEIKKGEFKMKILVNESGG